MKNNLILDNRSQIKGGQENFAELLLSRLGKNGWPVFYRGMPELEIRSSDKKELLSVSRDSLINILIINGNRSLYVNALRRKHGAKWIYVQHSSVLDKQAGMWRSALRAVVLRFLLLRVDAVVRVSRAALPRHWAPGKIRTIYNGLPMEEWPLKKHWRDSAERPLRLLLVGSINKNKNQELAIRVLRILKRCELILVGAGPEEDHLKHVAQELGVADRIEWVGYQDNTGWFYREADAYLMLSKFEAMPFVMLESMASGTPVVGFPVGGVGEVVENGVDGVLLNQRTPEALAEAIRPLLDEPERLKEMGLKARAKIEKSFTDERMADEFEQLIGELCGGKFETRG